jgi:anti-sigma-K factor RskA
MADDLDMLAGEYSLGTLDASERAAFRRRLLTDPAAAAAVAQWQERLAPLLSAVPEVAPPAALRRRIERTAVPANDNRLRRWQAATVAATLVALVTSSLALRPRPPAPAPSIERPGPPLLRSVAALSEDGGEPALLVIYDRARRQMRVMPVNVTARPGHSLQLWVIAGEAPPRPIGLMREKGETALDRMTLDMDKEMTIAVSVEPRGGSPTGLPTGPVVYSGRMIALPTS